MQPTTLTCLFATKTVDTRTLPPSAAQQKATDRACRLYVGRYGHPSQGAIRIDIAYGDLLRCSRSYGSTASKVITVWAVATNSNIVSSRHLWLSLPQVPLRDPVYLMLGRFDKSCWRGKAF